jgi:hypothetical protein
MVYLLFMALALDDLMLTLCVNPDVNMRLSHEVDIRLSFFYTSIYLPIIISYIFILSIYVVFI